MSPGRVPERPVRATRPGQVGALYARAPPEQPGSHSVRREQCYPVCIHQAASGHSPGDRQSGRHLHRQRAPVRPARAESRASHGGSCAEEPGNCCHAARDGSGSLRHRRGAHDSATVLTTSGAAARHERYRRAALHSARVSWGRDRQGLDQRDGGGTALQFRRPGDSGRDEHGSSDPRVRGHGRRGRGPVLRARLELDSGCQRPRDEGAGRAEGCHAAETAQGSGGREIPRNGDRRSNPRLRPRAFS